MIYISLWGCWFQIILFSAVPCHFLQKLIFENPPPNVRKIVLATNMAEASITINDIVFVVDCGKAKETTYDALNNTPCLLPSWISQASARQVSCLYPKLTRLWFALAFVVIKCMPWTIVGICSDSIIISLFLDMIVPLLVHVCEHVCLWVGGSVYLHGITSGFTCGLVGPGTNSYLSMYLQQALDWFEEVHYVVDTMVALCM
jgi:hypothetical protein